MNKRYVTLIYAALNILAVCIIGYFDPYIRNIGDAFYQIKVPWLLCGAACILLYWVFDAFILDYSLASIYSAESFIKCLKISIIGQYYNALTPFASGGQPFQVFYLMKIGVPVGFATSSLIIKFLVYQIVLSIYCIVAFIFKADFITTHSQVALWTSIIGFIINAGAVLLIYFASKSENLVRKVTFKVFRILRKIRLIKNIERAEARLLTHIEDFHRSTCLIQGNYRAILIMCFLTFIQLGLFFSITFFIYKSFGLDRATWLDIILVQALLYLAVSFVPTPGSTGATEVGFIFFFQLFFHKRIIFVAMLLWRIISYYMNIVAGGIIILGDGIRRLIRPVKHE